MLAGAVPFTLYDRFDRHVSFAGRIGFDARLARDEIAAMRSAHAEYVDALLHTGKSTADVDTAMADIAGDACYRRRTICAVTLLLLSSAFLACRLCRRQGFKSRQAVEEHGRGC